MKAAMFNLRHVQALAAAARHGTISGAAKAIGLSQPAMTQAIARLETQTGLTLLERSRSGVRPTDAGILLAARAEAAGQVLAALFRPFRRGGTGGRSGAERDVTMAQLQALLALAEAGSYVGAAAATGLSEPSLHRAVADLERVAGVTLAERRGRGVVLTESGRRMSHGFRIAARELDAAMDELAVLAGRDQGHVRIAATATALARLIPETVARFTRDHPPVTIEIEEATIEAAAARIAEGRLDAAIGHAPVTTPEGIEIEALAADGFAIVAREGHPLAAGATPGLARLSTFTWALPPEGSDERAAWTAMFIDGGLYPPAPGITAPSVPALLRIIAPGDLLAFASPRLVEPGLTTIGAVQSRPLALATRRGWYPTPAQAAFLDELRAVASGVMAF